MNPLVIIVNCPSNTIHLVSRQVVHCHKTKIKGIHRLSLTTEQPTSNQLMSSAEILPIINHSNNTHLKLLAKFLDYYVLKMVITSL